MKWMLTAAVLWAGGNLPAQTVAPRPQATVTGIDAAPAPENLLSDPRWQESQVVPLSLQAPSNVKFATPPESTQVRLLWCKDRLLVRFDCQDKEIVHLPGTEGAQPRDWPYFKADCVEIFLDPVGDGRAYMEFQFSPNGGVFDAIYLYTTTPQWGADFLLNGDVVNRDLYFFKEWNLDGLESAAKVWPVSEGQGWSVVAALPGKDMLQRLGQKEFKAGMKMKANFVRFDYFADAKHPPDITNWSPVLAGCAHVSPAGMGTLVLQPVK